ncbi:UDP-N-acetylglucosamine 2-epimerase (non-hydrolyzing) [bacterium]|nr:UDP-N-acetylglucosamine 2-epimerase (non-hydrolyzing) [bacterium]
MKTKRLKISCVAGARPNFMKIAPLINEMKKYDEFEPIIVHTGQHYDSRMSELFFDHLNIPSPDINLGVGSATHAVQTARIMMEYEPVILREKPLLTLVVGDVNSTIACSLVSVKLGVPVAHVEAGLRSGDRTMPEEINRILTDSISDYLFVTEESGIKNLKYEGIPEEKVFFVGNVMIDTLKSHQEKSDKSKILDILGLKKGEYTVLTLHRPSNVDNYDSFFEILNAIDYIQDRLTVVFPVHPRTRNQISVLKLGDLINKMSNFVLSEPLGYLDFLKLMKESRFVLTDSGGMQEETTVLGIPCVTLRENTERPVTIYEGTNILAGTKSAGIINAANEILKNKEFKKKIPKLWDGKAASRIIEILKNKLMNNI